jgi:hypothetical protein
MSGDPDHEGDYPPLGPTWRDNLAAFLRAIVGTVDLPKFEGLLAGGLSPSGALMELIDEKIKGQRLDRAEAFLINLRNAFERQGEASTRLKAAKLPSAMPSTFCGVGFARRQKLAQRSGQNLSPALSRTAWPATKRAKFRTPGSFGCWTKSTTNSSSSLPAMRIVTATTMNFGYETKLLSSDPKFIFSNT